MLRPPEDLVQRNWAVWNVEYRRIAGPNWKDANSTLEDGEFAMDWRGPRFCRGLVDDMEGFDICSMSFCVCFSVSFLTLFHVFILKEVLRLLNWIALRDAMPR